MTLDLHPYEELSDAFDFATAEFLWPHHEEIYGEIDRREEILSETWTDYGGTGQPDGFESAFFGGQQKTGQTRAKMLHSWPVEYFTLNLPIQPFFFLNNLFLGLVVVNIHGYCFFNYCGLGDTSLCTIMFHSFIYLSSHSYRKWT